MRGKSFIAAWVAGQLYSSLPGSPHSPFVRRAKGAPKGPTWLPEGPARCLEDSSQRGWVSGSVGSSGGEAGASPHPSPQFRQQKGCSLAFAGAAGEGQRRPGISPLERRANGIRGSDRGNPLVIRIRSCVPEKTSQQVLRTSCRFRSFLRSRAFCWERLVGSGAGKSGDRGGAGLASWSLRSDLEVDRWSLPSCF